MGIERNIAKFRRQQGMTQGDLATKVGVTREYLVSIETGKEKVSLRVLAQIAAALGVGVRTLEEN